MDAGLLCAAMALAAALAVIWAQDSQVQKLKRELELSIQKEEEARKREARYAAMLPDRLLKLFQKGDSKEIRIGEDTNIRAAILSFNIARFSEMVRSRTAKELFCFVNEVLEQAVPDVLHQEGEIERFVGAGFRAFYPDSPERALRSAVSICESMNRNCKEKQDYAIGISYGDVMAGMVGHEKRLGLLTLSGNTGLAEYLQELAVRYRARILITGSVSAQIPDFEKCYNSRYLGCIYLKKAGVTEDLYDVYDGDEPEDKNGKRKSRLLFEKGVELFQERRFYDARLHFIEVLKANRMDGAAREYLYLCSRHEAEKEEVPAYLEIY